MRFPSPFYASIRVFLPSSKSCRILGASLQPIWGKSITFPCRDHLVSVVEVNQQLVQCPLLPGRTITPGACQQLRSSSEPANALSLNFLLFFVQKVQFFGQVGPGASAASPTSWHQKIEENMEGFVLMVMKLNYFLCLPSYQFILTNHTNEVNVLVQLKDWCVVFTSFKMIFYKRKSI